VFAELVLQARDTRDQRIPLPVRVHPVEHVPGERAERVHHRGVELPTPPGPCDLDRGVHPAGSVVHLDDVRQVEQAHQRCDLLTADAARHAFGVPSGEHLPQRIAHVLAQTESLGHPHRGQAVRQQAPLHRLAAGDHQVAAAAEPVQQGAARGDVAQREAEQRQPREVDGEAVPPIRDVVPEPGRHFRGVGHAPRPGQRRHVVQRCPHVRTHVEVIGQAAGDHP